LIRRRRRGSFASVVGACVSCGPGEGSGQRRWTQGYGLRLQRARALQVSTLTGSTPSWIGPFSSPPPLLSPPSFTRLNLFPPSNRDTEAPATDQYTWWKQAARGSCFPGPAPMAPTPTRTPPAPATAPSPSPPPPPTTREGDKPAARPDGSSASTPRPTQQQQQHQRRDASATDATTEPLLQPDPQQQHRTRRRPLSRAEDQQQQQAPPSPAATMARRATVAAAVIVGATALMAIQVRRCSSRARGKVERQCRNAPNPPSQQTVVA